MNPFFFGSSDRQLFGVYHAPERAEVRDGAVVLCPALGHEYIASHGSLQQLGTKLARAGFHALRFDYSGCGDSAGDMSEASIRQWRADVRTAVQELRDTSGSRRVTVAGLRLGGTLAALAAADAAEEGDGGILATVLWEPVVRGSDYVSELIDVQARWMRAMYLRPRKQMLHHDGFEILGFPMPSPFRAELEKIDLLELNGRPSERVLIVQNTQNPRFEQLSSRLSASHNGVALEVLPSKKAWLGEYWATIALPPHDVLQRIVTWVTEVYR